MTDQVESLEVEFQDGASANAKKAADSILGVGDAAVAAETKTQRAGKGIKKATDEVAAGAAAAAKVMDGAGKAAGAMAGEIERSAEPVKRASLTLEQIANKLDRTKREAAAVAKATAPYVRMLEDLERASGDAAQKEELRAIATAKMEAAAEKARAAVARSFKDIEAGAAAANASAGELSAGMAAMNASANSWAGALGKVYETAGSMSGGLNQAARALRDLNAGLASGHTSFAEWTAGAKGLEASLRGVSAAQKAINDSTGVSRQNVNTATIGTLKYAVTGNAAPTGNTLGLVTGDAEASAQRLEDIKAAFAEADAAVDGYRESLGLADAAQRKFEAGQKELQQAIRLAGVEEAEAAKLLDAYASANDPALKKKVADWDAAARERDADAQMILADEKALADAAAKTAVENAKLAASYNQVMGAVDPALAAEQRYQKALVDLRAGAAAAGRSMDELAADEARLAASMSPAAIAAKKEEDALRSLIGGLDRSFFASEKLAKGQAILDQAMAEGVNGIRLSREQHAALSKVLADQHAVLTRGATGTKLAAHEMTNLTYQIQDTFVSLAGGQNPLMVLMQQGPQATSAVGGVGRAVALLTSPLGLAVMGATAVAGAFALVGMRAAEIGAHTRRLTVDIQAMGNASGVSAGQLRAIETQLRQQGVSGDAAFASVRTLAGARGLPSSMLGDVASIGRNMAAGSDDVTESVKSLTDALTEGYVGIRKLDDQFNFLTVDERRQIETMARHGDQAGVLKTAIDALHRQFDGLHEKALSPAGAAMERLSAGYNRLLDSIASRPIVIKGLEALALLLDKTAGSVGAPTRAEQIAGMRHELSELDKQYSRLPEKTSGVQTAHEAIILRRIDLQTKLNELQKADVAAQSSQIRTGAPRTAGTSSARTGAPDPAAAKYVDEQAAAFDRLSDAMQGNAVQRALAQADMRAEEEIRDRRLRGAAADEIRTIRQKEAILQLTVAVNDNNRAAAADIAGNDLVARAYGVSTAAVREATIHQKALAEAARSTIEPYDAIVARLRAVDDATRKVQAAQFNATLKQQTDDANRLAAAWGKGANAAREAALANEVLGEARKRGLDPNRDAGEIANIGSGVLARDLAQRTQQFSQMASEQQRAVELANAEFDMLGQSNAERAKTVAILQASNDLRDKGADLTDAGTKAYIEQAGEIARVKSILEEAGQTAANITQPIASGLEDVIVGAKGAGDAVKALGEDLKRIAARQLVTKPFETAVSGALTRLMSGGISVANDNRPTPANDPGGLDRLITTVKGGLGSSASNPMWVQMSSGSAAFDVGAMMSSAPLPVAIKDAGNLEGIIQGAAAKYGVDPNIIKGIIQQESSWNASAVNKTSGAAGLMQIMPANLRAYGVSNAFDPAENIDTGTRILKEHLVRAGGDLDKALSTYSGHIKTSGDAYVTAVKGSAATYAQAGNGLKLVVDNTRGVTAAQENQLQALLDAVPVQRAATGSAQTLTTAQQSLVDSVLVTAKANTDAVTVVDVQSRAISTLGANAISVAEHLDDAGDATKGLAKASEDSSSILLSGARSVYNGFSSVVSSLWSSVTSLFSSGAAGGGGATVNGQPAVTGGATFQGLGSYSNLASLGQAGYQIYTGGGGMAGTAANWFATSSLGSSLGFSAPVTTANAIGVQGLAQTSTALQGTTSALTGSGSSFVSGVSMGAPYGMIGGMGGAYLSNQFMGGSKIGGAVTGAALGAGSLAAGTMMTGGYAALAAIPVYGWITAAVLAAVTAALGSNKPTVGPNAAGNLYIDSSGAKSGPSAGDNGMDGSGMQSLTDAASQAINVIVGGIGASFQKGIAEQNFGHITYYQEGNKWALQNMQGGNTVGDKQMFASQEELVQGIIRQTLTRLDQGGQVTGFSADVRTALANSKATKPEDLAADITFGAGFRDQLKLMQDSLDPTNNQIKAFTENAKKIGEAVKTSILDWHDKALELGLATEGELVPALKKGLLAMMGLGPAAQPLLGMAAVTKQATIEFEQYKPALLSLGYSTAEVADLAIQYTSKAQKAYQDATAYTKRQGSVAIEALADPTVKATASDRLQGLGLDPKNSAIARLATVIGNVEAAARAGSLTLADERWALGQLNAQYDAGQISAEQYTTAVGYLTQAWDDSASAAQKAAEKVQASEDLTVRALRGMGLTDQADDYARGLQHARDYQTAITAGFDATYLAGLKFVQWLENVAATAERVAKADNARADIFTRAVSASGNSVWAATLRFDTDAAQQRQGAWNNGLRGQDIANLNTVLAAERGETVFKAAQQSVLDWYDREIAAKSELVTSIQDGALKVAQAAKQFQQAADSIRLSEDAPISPQERLTEAKRQWDAALGTINSTTASESDKDTARAALTSLGQTLVSIEKTNSAGTARSLYDEVLKVFGKLGDLSALGDGVATAEADLKVAQDQLKELQKARSEAANYGQRTVGNLESLNATMRSTHDDWMTAINGLSSVLTPANANTGTGGGVVAPDKGGTSAAKEAGQWMSNWFAQYDSYTAKNNAGQLSQDEWQKQGAMLFQDKVNKANALPLDPTVWNAFIQAAAAGSDDGRTAAWLRQVAHDKGVPGFATGTLATPPGAVWVGERGPELMWQAGGAAVASSADSMRIAGLYETAANDRWSGNVSSFQPPQPARPVSSDNTAAIVAELRRLNAQIVELKKGLHDEEGSAQNQRGVLLTRLIRAVEDLKAELADLKPARVA